MRAQRMSDMDKSKNSHLLLYMVLKYGKKYQTVSKLTAKPTVRESFQEVGLYGLGVRGR